MSEYEVATLKKGLLLLEALQEEDLTLSQLMNKLSFNKTTTYRLLYTLREMGYVEKKQQTYRITNKLGGVSPFSPKLNWLSVPPLYALSEEIGETVYVGLLHGTDVVTVQVIDGTHAMRVHSNIGDRSPVHLSALGKVMLAFLDEKSRDDLLGRLSLTQNTSHTFVDPHLFKHHLKNIQQQGYAVDDEETELGLRCIAVPVVLEGHVIAAVAVAGPSTRLLKRNDKQISKRLKECSDQLNKLL
ncbi:IclR family transcriptional regulator [Bacillus kexueae]|uniref:IclR family transcriptional regulator n=1 Tax=Aeribacillus kexueae TaxID=2078952 RepID=UPI001FAECE87|nr:IclR family transcriptional regulator [Bacillus kexueae]